MTGIEVLRVAVGIERLAAEIYRLFYVRFQDDLTATYLWHSLALEEDGHADFIEAEIKMMTTVPDAFGSVNIDAALLIESRDRMASILEIARKNNLSLEQAVCCAIQIEREMVEERYDRLIEVVSPSLKRIFRELTENSDHVERLEGLAKKLGLKCP